MEASSYRKRRGVSRASVTKLVARVKDLEAKVDDANTLELARQAQQKLERLDLDFKTHHLNLIDVIDDGADLEKEQEILDHHDDEVATLTARIQRLITTCASPSKTGQFKIATRRLQRVKGALSSIVEAIEDPTMDRSDICLLRHHEERVGDLKREIEEVRNSLLPFDIEEEDALNVLLVTVEKEMFACSLKIRKLIQPKSGLPGPPDSTGVKLPKLDVPTFDGNILHWRSFWEQYEVSVHTRSNLTDAEKLVYLQHALKDGSARQAIEGLSRSGDHYGEAIECLQARYDRPRLIHQAHVRMILEAPPLKDGNGRELRRLHDVVLQHLRALKAMKYEPSGPFITSVLEHKLDVGTMFEWQKCSQGSRGVPHYQDLLEFINLRAQASEVSTSEPGKKQKGEPRHLGIGSFMGAADPSDTCVACRVGKHPLYSCQKFKSLSHDKMLSTLKVNKLCFNCFKPDHHVKDCKSTHLCKKCRKPHHTLLHVETKGTTPPLDQEDHPKPASAHAAVGIKSDLLLMTCRVKVESPNGSSVDARALLDCASSISFISERLAQSLRLPRINQKARVSGVAGFVQRSHVQSVASFRVARTCSPEEHIEVAGVVVPRVTCDLPLQPVTFDMKWNHLSGIELADPEFGLPGRIDLLLGVEVFAEAMLQGRRYGPPGSPVAFETKFGWVLAGGTVPQAQEPHFAAHHASGFSGDDVLCKFWELEEQPSTKPALSPEERSVMQQFKEKHRQSSNGRFIVPLPRKPNAKPLGESRSQAVRRFHYLERSLRSKGKFCEFEEVMDEYIKLGHAELVPDTDLQKPPEDVFYLPVHLVRKESSTTTKVRAVFDASAKSSTGVSLNDMLMVGPTVHSTLIDVLIHFSLYRVALTADVSKMYRGIELPMSDRDLHRFVWRSSEKEPLKDYRMTRVTFGVSASSFAANMCVKQNTLDHAMEYPLALKAVEDNFYVDDSLTGAHTVEDAVVLQGQLQSLFCQAQLLLRKWNSSDPQVLEAIPPELRDSQSQHPIPEPEEYRKTLGIEWNAARDHFQLTVTELPSLNRLTKRALISDVAKTYDILGWYSPTIIKAKILFQRLWELKVEWDDPVPPSVRDIWLKWRSELHLLSDHRITRCYFPKEMDITCMQLHGFSDASEVAYSGVVYLRVSDAKGEVHVSLVMSKTKVAPLKRQTIPRLELCGAHLLAQLLHHVREVFNVPQCHTYAWTDSTVVLNWLAGSSRCFKAYVGNRVSLIVDLVAPNNWRHVNGAENPADCASRGIFPSELVTHELWWNGPSWLHLDPTNWPKSCDVPPDRLADEGNEICLHVVSKQRDPIIPVDKFSNFTHLRRVTAWVKRFFNNCRVRDITHRVKSALTVKELVEAESYWLSINQQSRFAKEIDALKQKREISLSSSLLSLRPFLDTLGVLRVGGREQLSKLSYERKHPVVLEGKHSLTKLIVWTEHLRLLHAGPTLLAASLSRRYHIVRGRHVVRSVTRSCVTCRRSSAKPQPPLMGQLPMERITPDAIFSRVGLDYAGPLLVKYGSVRKPTVAKAYICVFVSLSVKAVHLELVSDLTTETFIAALRRFIGRRGKPILLWSDHGSNFVGAARELLQLNSFLAQQRTQQVISEFCTSQNIEWVFIPERSPHFGGLWESAVKSLKLHLKRVAANVKLTFEELTTLLVQIEACLNSRPLLSLPSDDDGVDVLTPGHFLIGRPMESLPDPAFSYRPLTLLRRWHLCQALLQHFWKRWSSDYLASLRKFTKWHHPNRNLSAGDIVVVQEDNTIPTKWPLARVTKAHPGKDGIVRVVTVQTPSGTYTRPAIKIVPLLACD